MQELETRFAEVRLDSGKRSVSGYGAVFYDGTASTEYSLGGNTVERIHPSAFDESLKANKVKLYRMHDRQQGLARTPGTLRLSKDSRGIAYEATIIDSTAGRDAIAELESGYLTGASVGMRFGPDDLKFSREGNRQIATVMRADLVEISLVDDAAYSGTTAILRYANQAVSLTLDEMQKTVKENLDRLRSKRRTAGPSAGTNKI